MLGNFGIRRKSDGQWLCCDQNLRGGHTFTKKMDRALMFGSLDGARDIMHPVKECLVEFEMDEDGGFSSGLNHVIGFHSWDNRDCEAGYVIRNHRGGFFCGVDPNSHKPMLAPDPSLAVIFDNLKQAAERCESVTKEVHSVYIWRNECQWHGYKVFLGDLVWVVGCKVDL